MKAVFIIGPSGAGKTTLTTHLSDLYSQLFGQQQVITLNLDCANDQHHFDIDISQLVQLDDIMQEFQLGPNGSLLYSIDLLWKNKQWLFQKIDGQLSQKNPSLLKNLDNLQQLQKTQANTQKSDEKEQEQTCNTIILIDLPGQIQLYLSYDSMKLIITTLVNKYKFSACMLQLFDATYIYRISDFVSMSMMSLTMQLNVQLPHVALLNKIDLLKGRKPERGMLEEYFSVQSLLQMTQQHHENPDTNILQKISKIVDAEGKVSFLPCSIYQPDLLNNLIFQLEKIFGTLQNNLVGNKKFVYAMKEHLGEFNMARIVNNLEAELFSQEQQVDFAQELRKIRQAKSK